MIFSSSAEYAIRGLSELALRNATGWVMLDEVVAGSDMPRDFVAKIFQRLVHAEILHSSKGPGGGFSLARPAERISLMQIVEAVDGPQQFERCVVGFDHCNDKTPCPQHELYKPIRQRLRDYMNTTTLADLASSLRSKRALLARVAAGGKNPAAEA